MRLGKKVPVLDENRRHTYGPPQLYPSVLATFDGEKRQLVPVSSLFLFIPELIHGCYDQFHAVLFFFL